MQNKRLAKEISARGYCSRRDAEKLILDGKVEVSNKTVRDIVYFVSSDDEIKIHGKIIQKISPKIWVYYKPRGVITSHKDPQNRRTVFEELSGYFNCHIKSIGRLDIESEGLLLLTNSGEIARKFELPENNFKRIYKVKLFGNFNAKAIDALTKGAEIENIKYKECLIKHLKSNTKMNHWFEVTLFEGKNREIRKMFESIGMQVSRLIRTQYHKYELADLKPGEVKICPLII